MDSIVDEKGNPVVLDDETALDMVNIWYTMQLTAFRKYESTIISNNVSDETVAEIMENTAELQGVTIEESWFGYTTTASILNQLLDILERFRRIS